MPEDTEKLLKIFHRTNIIVWACILSVVIILTIIAAVIKDQVMLTPFSDVNLINQIFFIIAVLVAFAILFLKRSMFSIEKVTQNIAFESFAERIGIVFSRLRKNYLLVWIMGESIAALGFANFILTVDFKSMLLFAVVSAYSVLINMPRINLAQICIDRIQ
jgi:hypothetical protein